MGLDDIDPCFGKYRTNARAFLVARQLTMLAPLITFLLIAWQSYHHAVASAKQDLEQAAVLIADHSQKVFESADALLRSLNGILRMTGGARSRDFSAVIDYLDDLTKQNSQIEIAGAADAQGDIVVSSRFRGPVNIQAREYFLFHRDRRNDLLFVGAPIKGGNDKAESIPISRRINSKDGTFDGVVFAALSREGLRRFFADAAGDDADHAGLVTNNGYLDMATHVSNREDIERSRSILTWINPDLLAADKGAVDYVDASGVRRMLSYRKIDDAGAIAVAERRRWSVVGPWLWSMLVYFSLFWAAASGLYIAVCIVERRTKAVLRAKSAIRKLSGQILQRQDCERRRIAREIHDSTAQSLLAASLELKLAADCAADRTASTRIDGARSLINVAQQELRTLAYVLHPPMLDEAGLLTALRHLAEGFEKRSSIRVSIEVFPQHDNKRLPPEIEITLFRIVQESLTNAYRHSNARHIIVALTTACPSVGQLRLCVRDDGIRPPTDERLSSPVKIGVGIGGMRERLHALGGELKVQFDTAGTSVIATLNLAA